MNLVDLLDYCGEITDGNNDIPPFSPLEAFSSKPVFIGSRGRCEALEVSAPGQDDMPDCGRDTVICPRCRMDAGVCKRHLVEEKSGARVCPDCYLR